MGKASRKNKTPEIVKKQRNLFPLIITAIVVAIVLIIGITVIALNTNHAQQNNADQATTAPSGVTNDGFVINKDGLVPTVTNQPVDVTLTESTYNSDKNNISLYVDYACPHCAEFEKANLQQIEKWLQDGTIDTLTIHPMAFLTNYSQIGGNALSCVAEYDPKNILKAHETLTTNFDKGLNVKQTLNVLQEAGVSNNDEFTACVRGGKYNDFIAKATARAQNGPIPSSSIQKISGTPTVLVNGQRYTQSPTDANAFAAFVTTTTATKPQETQE